MRVVRESPIRETPRVQQVRGIFDLREEKTSRVEFDVAWADALRLKDWHLGLVVGPSGCGKSTVARALWGEPAALTWPENASVLDAFPEGMGVKEVVELLSSVGFSSPPAWLRPFQVLSTGQQFRVTLARVLAEALTSSPQPGRPPSGPVVFDEFTSVVDRTVAQIGSAALARTVRAKGLQFVAVTCHEDVEEWLQPDWVYRPAENLFTWRCLRRRPAITLRIVRCQASAWTLFRHHHYLSETLAPSAVCFLATWKGLPVCFSAWLPFVGTGPKAYREHRTVCLPDYQGIGIGNAVSDTLASMWTALGYVAKSTTTHPAMIRSRQRSPNWVLTRAPALCLNVEKKFRSVKHAATRMTAGFEYVGPAMNRRLARALHGG